MADLSIPDDDRALRSHCEVQREAASTAFATSTRRTEPGLSKNESRKARSILATRSKWDKPSLRSIPDRQRNRTHFAVSAIITRPSLVNGPLMKIGLLFCWTLTSMKKSHLF